MTTFRIWKIGAPTRHLGQSWWPVFERRFDGGLVDDPPIAFCVEAKGRFKSQNAHDLIDWLRENA